MFSLIYVHYPEEFLSYSGYSINICLMSKLLNQMVIVIITPFKNPKPLGVQNQGKKEENPSETILIINYFDLASV